MTRYAIGDIQGCLQPLQCLLEQVCFDPQQDQLWLVGDLINRGPHSLETLRFVKELSDTRLKHQQLTDSTPAHCTRIVLGNHDLHFLAVAFGTATLAKSDTLNDLLAAKDCEELMQWLLQQ